MNRTPLLTPIIRTLAALNSQTMFLLFAEHELKLRIGQFSPKAMKYFTSDLFANNVYAPSLHVTVDELSRTMDRTANFAYGAFFSTSNEVLMTYYDQALELLRQVHGPGAITRFRVDP